MDEKDNMLIKIDNISKSFGGINALTTISLDIKRGEIHCLCGENGAGKSTLMKILSGAYQPTSGTITIEGREHHSLNPKSSQSSGIQIIYQENLLVPTMNIVENMFVGQESVNPLGFIKRKQMEQKAREAMADLGIELELFRKVEDLSIAEQQFVKILKALVLEPKCLIMDEPTSMFNIKDANRVLKLVKRIASKGISIIYISHFLKEVVEIADRITVIRDGSKVNTYSNKNRDISLDIITRDMVGRSVDMFFKREKAIIGKPLLTVKDLRLSKNSPSINFVVRRGEILGMAGMVGSGRTEIVRAISGAEKRKTGDIYINDEKVKISNPRDSIKLGIAHITEDRQRLGLMLNKNVLENLYTVSLNQHIKGFFMNMNNHTRVPKKIVDDLKIKTPSIYTLVKNLSGGNQQKVVLGKWLMSAMEIFIFDEPTRGIDVNSKTEFYKIISNLAKEGKAIIIVSSDMPELISMSDRILVVKKGAIVCELKDSEINEDQIIRNALEV